MKQLKILILIILLLVILIIPSVALVTWQNIRNGIFYNQLPEQVPTECVTAKDCQDIYKNCYYSCSSNKCVQIQTFVALKPYPDCSSVLQSMVCSSPDDTSCPAGYKCIQSCGPPVARQEDPPPPYFCELNEIANKPRNCPICLASNTNISTPNGDINVKNIKVGMHVWSLNKKGEKVVSTVIKISNTDVLKTHKVVHLVLSDKREVWVSANHPTINGLYVGKLKVGDIYDGFKVLTSELINYWDNKTYDILPDSETGYYWANGILLGSTIHL